MSLSRLAEAAVSRCLIHTLCLLEFRWTLFVVVMRKI